jgi:hypothetical protein
MLHNTLGGDLDAHWVALLCSSSTAAATSPLAIRQRVAVRPYTQPIPSRVRSTRPAIGPDHDRPDIAAKTLGRTRRDRETGRSRPHTDVRDATRLPHAF